MTDAFKGYLTSLAVGIPLFVLLPILLGGCAEEDYYLLEPAPHEIKECPQDRDVDPGYPAEGCE